MTVEVGLSGLVEFHPINSVTWMLCQLLICLEILVVDLAGATLARLPLVGQRCDETLLSQVEIFLVLHWVHAKELSILENFYEGSFRLTLIIPSWVGL